MKRALILCLFLAFNVNNGDCSTTLFPPLQPIGGSNLSSTQAIKPNGAGDLTDLVDPFIKNTYLADSSANYPRINEIEHSLYGQNFSKQDILLRLSRIEKSIFNSSYPSLTLAQRVDNIILNYNQIAVHPNISQKVLSKMESKIFGRNYGQNDAQTRIERLEQEIFGAAQSGDVSSRYETLKTAVSNYKPDQIASNYCQDPLSAPRGGFKGILGGIGSVLFGNMLGGTMTGFSPSLDPFSNSYGNSNGYGNNNGYNNFANLGGNFGGNPGSGMYQGYRSNRGYSDQYTNYGTGSRVTILD